MGKRWTEDEIAARIEKDITPRFPNGKRRGGSEWVEDLCPKHNNGQERHASFAYSSRTGAYRCHACGISGSGLKDLCALLGIPHPFGSTPAPPPISHQYTDEHRSVVYEVLRHHAPKRFQQRRPDGKGGWIWNVKGVVPVLYRLPEVVTAPADATIFVAEGEKDADRLASLGVVATTSAMGAGKWLDRDDKPRPQYIEPLRGRHVVIFPDNDDAGRKHAQQVSSSLQGIAASVRIVSLPNLPKAGDVSDFLDAGGTRTDLERLSANMAEEPDNSTRDAEQIIVDAATESGNTTGSSSDGIRLVPASEIEPSRVEWAVPNLVPLGCITTVAGEPGEGKSTLTVCWAAGISTGALAGALSGIPANVALATSEDAPAEVVVPRLCAAGADLTRVHFIELRRDGEKDAWVLTPENVSNFRPKVLALGIRFLVIDPLVSHLPPKTDPHQDAAVRRVLAPLAQLAAEARLAVVAVMHFNKGDAHSALNRLNGSIAFGAASRSVLVLRKHPQNSDDSERVLVQIKSNYGALASALLLRLETRQVEYKEQVIPTCAIRVIGEAIGVSTEDVMRSDAPQNRLKRDDAIDFLKTLLANGPVDSGSVDEQATARGISQSTLRRAKDILGVA